METDEVVVESLGAVELRRIPAGCIAQTCAEGDMDTARGIALACLAQYLSGDNRDGVALDAERPVVQQRNAAGGVVGIRSATCNSRRGRGAGTSGIEHMDRAAGAGNLGGRQGQWRTVRTGNCTRRGDSRCCP